MGLLQETMKLRAKEIIKYSKVAEIPLDEAITELLLLKISLIARDDYATEEEIHTAIQDTLKVYREIVIQGLEEKGYLKGKQI